MRSVKQHGPRLGLGTAQFGLDYGITNDRGRSPENEVSAILETAARQGVLMLDTAPAYGEAETVLGRTLPSPSPFTIVTKTPKIAGLSVDEAVAHVDSTFRQSLTALNRPRVDGLLAHDADDLCGPAGAAIWTRMCALREEGLVGKLGVSVYTGAQIDAVLERYPIDVIQVPFNALDHRLVESGHLERLARLGIEIHARSIFLQGLLVSPGRLPATCPDDIRDHLSRLWDAWGQAGLSPLEGALAEGIHQPELSVLVIGVAGVEDLNQGLAAFDRAAATPRPFPAGCFSLSDHWIVDPRQWAVRLGGQSR
jgi:aryl-alcohol dehydrogenase-like predicted oxidoreductase